MRRNNISFPEFICYTEVVTNYIGEEKEERVSEWGTWAKQDDTQNGGLSLPFVRFIHMELNQNKNLKPLKTP